MYTEAERKLFEEHFANSNIDFTLRNTHPPLYASLITHSMMIGWKAKAECSKELAAAQAEIVRMRQLLPKISSQGVQLGKCWFSHEKITGYSAEQLNAGHCGIIANNYMEYIFDVKASSQLNTYEALDEALAKAVEPYKQDAERYRVGRELFIISVENEQSIDEAIRARKEG